MMQGLNKEMTIKSLLSLALIMASLSEPERFPWWMAILVMVFVGVFRYFFSSREEN